MTNYLIDTQTPNWTTKELGDFNGDGNTDIFWRDEATGDNQIWFMDGQDVTIKNITALANNWKLQGVADFNGNGFDDLFWQDPTTGKNKIWFMSGTNVSESEVPKPMESGWEIQSFGDFNGDGKADILWQKSVSSTENANAIWLMDATTVTDISGTRINRSGSNWQVQGTYDYNGDGKADILWHDPETGQNAVWMMDGTTVTSGKNISVTDLPEEEPPNPIIDTQSSNWTTKELGDFNGDGNTDIFWRDEATGDNQIWFIDGENVTIKNITALANNWELQGVADFNGNGFDDLFWQDPTTGNNRIWFMNGTNVSESEVPKPTESGWQIQSFGDFNGDGKAEILWQKPESPTQNANAIWMLDFSTVVSDISGTRINRSRSNWQVQATDDFNGNSKADILWRDPVTGQNAVWLMDGTTVTSGRNISGATSEWEVQGTGDFNSDGKADILWRDNATGKNAIWKMDGTVVLAKENISSADSRWEVQGIGDFNNDGSTDIFWRDPASGENALWLMEGLTNPSGSLLA